MSEHFGRASLRVAIAQLAHCNGFHALQRSVLDTLTDVTQRYLETLGSVAHQTAELSGRTEVNAVDVFYALEELQVDLAALVEFAKLSDDVPFAKCIQAFPIPKKVRISQHQTDPNMSSSIPAFYPSYPAPHTYMKTPVNAESAADEKEVARVGKQHNQEAEEALTRISSSHYEGRNHWGNLSTPAALPLSSITRPSGSAKSAQSVSSGGASSAPTQDHQNPYLKPAAKRKKASERTSVPNILGSPKSLLSASTLLSSTQPTTSASNANTVANPTSDDN